MSYSKDVVKISISNQYSHFWRAKNSFDDWGHWSDVQGAAEHKQIEKSESEWEYSIELPHSCDAWEIGGIEEARQLIADLNELIIELESKGV